MLGAKETCVICKKGYFSYIDKVTGVKKCFADKQTDTFLENCKNYWLNYPLETHSQQESSLCYECNDGYMLDPIHDRTANTYNYVCLKIEEPKMNNCRILAKFSDDCRYECGRDDPSEGEIEACLAKCHKGCGECKWGTYQLMSGNTWCTSEMPDRVYGTQKALPGKNYPDPRLILLTEAYRKIPTSMKYSKDTVSTSTTLLRSNRLLQTINGVGNVPTAQSETNYGDPIGGLISTKLLDMTLKEIPLKKLSWSRFSFFVPIDPVLKRELIINATTNSLVVNSTHNGTRTLAASCLGTTELSNPNGWYNNCTLDWNNSTESIMTYNTTSSLICQCDSFQY
jgi:hypothetical protein